jgi:hypothetical protein
LYYIKDDTLTLVDMYSDNGSRSLTEFQFFESPTYGKFSPVKKFSAFWVTYSAETGNSGGEHDLTISHYIKENDHEVECELYEYGSDLSITPYQTDEALVQSSLVMIRGILQKDKVSVSIPISSNVPNLGENISWTDTTLPDDTPGYIRVRTITYNFSSDEIELTGDGIFIRHDGGRIVLPQEIITGTTTIDSFEQTVAKGCVWNYVLDDGSRTNMRIGRIVAVWDEVDDSSPVIISSYSDEIGDTTLIVSFSVDKSGSTVRLRCTVTSGIWEVDGTRKLIGIQ